MADIPSSPISPPLSSTPETHTVIQSPSQTSPILLNLPIATKLNRGNYLTWKSQIEPLLHGYQLYKYITIQSPTPTVTDNAGLLKINPDYIPWHQQDQLILGWLRSSLTEPLQAQIINCATSRELWDYLKSTFSATSRARLSELRRQLQTTTKGGLSCADFVQKMRSIADELSFIGSPVSDDDLVLQILRGLGSEFNSFVVAANTRSEPLRLPELQAMLLTHESLLHSQHNTGLLSSTLNPSAFYSNPRPKKSNYKNFNLPQNPNSYRPVLNNNPFRPRFPFQGSLPNSYPSKTFQPRGPLLPTPSSLPATNLVTNQSQPNGPDICQICYKRGHTARVCYKRCDARYFDPPMQSTPPPQAFVAQPLTAPAEYKSPTMTEWIVDSSASHHVTHDINNLSSFLPYEGLNTLHIANGSGMPIKHIGSFSFTVSHFTFHIRDILHVPSFTKNLQIWRSSPVVS
jgi:gag-polypeptide of LTR copia-type